MNTGMSDLTYPDAGATRGGRLPRGYHHLHHRMPVADTPEAFDRAREAVSTFAMHRGAGARVRTVPASGAWSSGRRGESANRGAERAAPGVRLTVTLGPFTVPCEVVYVIDEPDRAGFGYGTLPGHQESGEEAFLVERDATGRVWLRVTAFSRPARWPTILAGPLAVAMQHAFARLLGRSLRRICTVNR
jgi:uncharacterized protein (UPF0548 family)